MISSRAWLGMGIVVVGAAVAQPVVRGPAASTAGSLAGDKAVARARREVKMLDDIYKTGVVLVTENFVDGNSSVPAGTVFKQLFAAAKAKGWHEVRLLDATGDAIDDDNLPRDEFERAAVKSLLGGQDYVEAVVRKEGQRYLRAATPIPVVMEKCIECHAHYADVPQGRAIGALAYTLPIQED